MINRQNFDLSSYFVVGPENTKGRPAGPIIKDAVEAGFTFIQIRSKLASAKELINLTVEASYIIKSLGKSNKVALVVNDRLDIVLAARKEGAKVDGIHVGQEDIPVEVCREYLGEDSIVGLTARTDDLFKYIETQDVSQVDYFGAGPLRKTMTKPDCGLSHDGEILTRSFEDFSKVAKLSPIPVVIGGGVGLEDIEELAKTGVDGFFVVSVISQADDPKEVAMNLVKSWESHKVNKK